MVSMSARSILLVALVVAAGCAEDEAPGTTTSDTRTQRRGARDPVAVSELDLKGMLSPVPEYEGQGRNLFAYGRERRAAQPPPQPPPRPSPSPTVRARTTTTVPRTTPMRPGAPLNIKYAGFVEKTEESGDKAKYAIFLDGNEILAGAEGEVIANRFTVVEIGLESVTVSTEGSSATQRIPLQAN